MKTMPVLALAAAFLLPGATAPISSEGAATPDDLPQAFSDDWAKGDGAALGQLMAEDGDFINVGGAWFHGRADFTLYHSRLLEKRFKDSRITPLETRVQMVRPDLALVRWSWRMTGDRDFDMTPRPPRTGIMTMLAEKQHDRWLILAAQNTNRGPGIAPENEGITFPIKLPPGEP